MAKVNNNVANAQVSEATTEGNNTIAQNTEQAVKVIAEGAKELSPLASSILEAQKKLAELQAQRKAEQAELKAQAEALNKQIAEAKAKAKAEAKEAKEAQNKLLKQVKEAKEGNTKGAICGRIIARLTLSGEAITPKVVGTLLANEHAQVLNEAHPEGEPIAPNLNEGIFCARYCIQAINAFNTAIAPPAEAPAE
jgi:FKBP-type peptidyl-prolyl cis-trans isomerase